jgi:type 1 glutamine amidotransferase
MAVFVVLSVLVLLVCSCNSLPETQSCTTHEADKIRVAVVTGGHDFDHEPFFELFDSLENIEYVEAVQSDESELFEDISEWDYDVIVLYNMTQEISPRRRENFIKLLKDGVGVVAMHHSIGAFQNWPEYKRIIGTKFYLQETEEDGVVYKVGSYEHDADFKIYVKDPHHPVTRGLRDFSIHDETYKGCVFESDNQVLLTTNHPKSDEPVCLVRNYKAGRVCYVQLGHGPSIFYDENYRQLIRQAIGWCAGRLN